MSDIIVEQLDVFLAPALQGCIVGEYGVLRLREHGRQAWAPHSAWRHFFGILALPDIFDRRWERTGHRRQLGEVVCWLAIHPSAQRWDEQGVLDIGNG